MSIDAGSIPDLEARLRVETAYRAFLEAQASAALPPLTSDELLTTLPRVWACSAYATRQCVRHPEFLAGERAVEFFRGALDEGVIAAEADAAESYAELGCALRRIRHRHMVRLAWRDIAGWAGIDEIIGECSRVAETLVRVARDWLYRDACRQLGLEPGGQGVPGPLIVLGMGKLGAWELNFSSDIDLIFFCSEDAVLPDRRQTSSVEFHTRIARRLIQCLDQVTEQGFAYRVDLRLRPFGDSGPLLMTLDAWEIYLQGQAREWERYALVKGRVLGGHPEDIAAVEALRVPFVYRRYLDYRAFGELRDMKARISQELMRNRHPDNVKLGAGGIREIEFIGQVFQLIRGGTEPALQQRGIIGVLEYAGRKGHLPTAVVAKLIEAYRFLRTVENRLQQFDDEQTHELPGCPQRQQLLAYALGHPDWSSFSARIARVREQVHDVFEQIMAAPHTEAMPVAVGAGEDPMSERGLRSMGFVDPGDLLELLQRFHSARVIKNLSARGAFELSRLMPLTLRAVSGQSKPVLLLERILDLYQAIASRNVYFSLLVENPLALSQLVKLASGSAWVVHYISQHPILLDELLDPRSLYQPGDRSALKSELDQRLSSVDCGDLERLMVALRQFKQANVLRVAASDIIGLTPLMVVSDYLTEIAETVVQAVLQRAWCLTAERHGVPPGANPDKVVGFGVVAYGKLGGIELGYSSDLDLVFLHESAPADAFTNGASPLACSEFYARVAKRVVALMTTQTHAGALYDIDLRLRPSGNSGLLVSSVEAYERYQLEAAWTWEQQSLVRARFVAGDDAMGRQFSRIRRASLTRAREIAALRGEVRDMRERMRRHLGERDPSLFDLKQGVGGIADVEFLVQFLVLAYARQHPELIRWTDTIRMLEGLRDVGQLSASDVDQLRTAYCRFRELGHHQALQERPAVVPVSEEAELRESVGHIWQRIMAE